MSIKNETNRLFLRGETATFSVYFYADAAQTTPLIPLDSALYPSYTIYDIENQPVQSGVGTPEISPGRYKTDFIVPSDAPLSQDRNRWRIEWVMVSDDERQVDFVEEFDVKDTVITASESREQKYISLIQNPFRSHVRFGYEPAEVALDVYSTTTNNKVVDDVRYGFAGGVQSAVDGDSIVYYYDIPADALSNPVQCFYSLIWKSRASVLDPQEFLYHNLTIVTPYTLNLVTSLRMLIDKFQKRLGVIQAYEDSDLVEYLQRGGELVNSVYPTTFYGFQTMPGALTVFHILFSAWYGLQAQRLLEVDLGFDFSGQTVSLNYDHASGLGDVASTWQDFIQENLAAAKMAILRRSTPVGSVGVRAYRYQQLSNYVYKINSGNPNGILGQLTTLGLLF